ncbi:phosphopantetheine adenylyltransferase [Methanococcoides methylutens]|uniref:Phosphopantetheine adenylyltransferase n=1 Tax=Methanococcoides methylutens MM1 TaxID=1434104 RepID=A0A0E3WZH9_METMT|nr:phosphopantetheine adenylyltransferase [Methanococcoides methylutens]AKB84304.1 Phosphopantetheine adenylyltransferase, type II eukaryotic [Methanococcoides methylutens MM1]
MGRTAVGGTFEYLHDGHKHLIKKAFETAGDDILDIGLTSDEMAGQKNRDIPDYPTRKANLLYYLKELNVPESHYQIQMLTDPYGTTLEGDYECIVVSPETYPVALKINELRKANGRPEIKIVRIEYVMADDDIPISSTRIVHGEIDVHGHLKGS